MFFRFRVFPKTRNRVEKRDSAFWKRDFVFFKQRWRHRVVRLFGKLHFHVITIIILFPCTIVMVTTTAPRSISPYESYKRYTRYRNLRSFCWQLLAGRKWLWVATSLYERTCLFVDDCQWFRRPRLSMISTAAISIFRYDVAIIDIPFRS